MSGCTTLRGCMDMRASSVENSSHCPERKGERAKYRMTFTRSDVAAVALVVGACFAAAGAPAIAQSYPTRVIKMIVPFTPGSPNDVMARLLTQHLQPRLGQAFVVENKPGGGTTIGTKTVAIAEPDGHT